MLRQRYGSGCEMSDIIDRLIDLHMQATTERSHYYTATVIGEAMGEITNLRLRVASLEKSLADSSRKKP